MTLIDLMFILLGAGLLSLGVLSGALADRIRGIRLMRAVTREARETPPREAQRVREPAEQPKRAERVPPTPAASPPRGTPIPHNAGMAADVIAALVNAGYRKSAAAQAASACTPSEQMSLSGWVLAALRRCSRSEVS